MPDLAAKAGWTRVAFGDVVRLSGERSAYPEKHGFERYVGLDHIDPGDLKIRRWGNISDGTTFTSVFRPGQVLFGKRRAYQRKIAVADFSGVCSGDIYVFEPKDSRLLAEFLPFICLTDGFFDHAIGTSAGSLSPRTNWNSLASYRFALPPLEEQQRIADLLISAAATIESLHRAAHTAGDVYRAVGAGRLARPGISGIDPKDWMQPGWTCGYLGDLVVPSAPICYGIVQVGSYDPKGIPTLAIKNLRGDFGDGVHRTSPSIESRYVRSRVQAGDLLLSIKASIGEAGVVPDGFEGNISRDIARLRFNPLKLNAQFFLHLYRSPRYTQYVNSRLVGSTRAELSIATLKQMIVPYPSLGEQARLVEEMDSLMRAQAALTDRAIVAATLNRHILHTVLWHEGSG